MSYFVYIIQSDIDSSYYKGFTENPLTRLLQHNNGESAYTAKITLAVIGCKMGWGRPQRIRLESGRIEQLRAV